MIKAVHCRRAVDRFFFKLSVCFQIDIVKYSHTNQQNLETKPFARQLTERG